MKDILSVHRNVESTPAVAAIHYIQSNIDCNIFTSRFDKHSIAMQNKYSGYLQ